MADGRYRYMAEKIGPASAASLVGCIDKIQFHGKEKSDKWVPYGTEASAVKTQGCFDNQEDGVFIPQAGGSLAIGKSLYIVPLNTTVLVMGLWCTQLLLLG